MTSESQPFVSVIVPVYNDPERLALCLQALEQQTYPTACYEVIAVDNNSDVRIEPVVERFAHARAGFEQRQGQASARNKGIELARGHVIAFTDADCIPEPDWLTNGIYTLQSDSNCGLVGGRVDVFAQNAQRPTLAERYDMLTAFPQQHLVERDHFSATANAFTFRHIVDEVGGFDPDFNIFFEDREWGERIFRAGYTLIYADNAVVKHPARPNFSAIYQRNLNYATGLYQLKKKRSYPFRAFIQDVMREIVPNVRLLVSLYVGARGQQLSDLREKTGVAGYFLLSRYVQLFQKIRLRLRDGLFSE